MGKASVLSLSLRAERSNLRWEDEFFGSLQRRLPRPFGPRNDLRVSFQLSVALLVAAFLPVSVRVQGGQRLQYQSANITLAAAQDASVENPQAGSDTQERDRIVGMTGLFFIVVVIAIGVLFAIVMVAGQ